MMMFISSDFLFAYSLTTLYFRFSAREILVVRSLIGQYPELYLDKLRLDSIPHRRILLDFNAEQVLV